MSHSCQRILCENVTNTADCFLCCLHCRLRHASVNRGYCRIDCRRESSLLLVELCTCHLQPFPDVGRQLTLIDLALKPGNQLLLRILAETFDQCFTIFNGIQTPTRPCCCRQQRHQPDGLDNKRPYVENSLNGAL